MLELNSIDVAYGEAIALRGVSMSVAEGTTVALIGSNGAGKSTLVKSLMGIQPLRGGHVLLDGKDLTHTPPSGRAALGVALVPEGRRLFPTMSVRDNLLMGLHDRVSKRNSRGGMDWVLDLFPILRERGRQHAGTLSGGEQQMVALGRALVSRPRLLILDEPSLGLAPVIVEQMFGILATIRNQGVTMMIAEQNMQAALTLSDYGYVLDDGRVTIEAPADELILMPAVRAAYLGA